MQFGKGVINERKRLNLSQVELSHRSNVPQQTISAIESGKNDPKESTMIMIADGLGCSVGKLLGEHEMENSPPKSLDELNAAIADAMMGLSDADFQRVLDFVSGLKAARKEPPSQQA